MGEAQRLLGQPGGQLFAHQRVPEAVAATHALDHTRRLRLAERPVDLLDTRERRELRAREAVVDYGERREQPLAERLQPLEPPRHHLAKPRRDRDLTRGVHRCRQLLRKERVARRRALDCGEGARRELPPGRALSNRCQRAPVERAERELHRGATFEQAGAHERRRLGERLIAHAGDHEQALAGGAASEMVHERRRRLVGGVQVVDGNHDAALRGGLSEQLTDRREDAMPVYGLLRRRCRVGHRGQQSRQGGLRAVGERAGQLRTPRGEWVERLHERRVGRAALLLVRGAAQRMEAELLRLGEHGLEKAGLADPQRAGDEQGAAIGGRSARERCRCRAELPLTPFDRAMEKPGRVDRRAARELALERQRLLGGLRPEPRELFTQEAELARGGRFVAARHVAAHERAVGLLVGGILAQHLVPPALGAHHRETALAQPRAWAEQPLLVALVGQQFAAVGGIVSGLEALDIGRYLGGRRELHHSARGAPRRRGRRARGARSSRPCAGWTRRHRRRAAARASRAPRRAACGGREQARAA